MQYTTCIVTPPVLLSSLARHVNVGITLPIDRRESTFNIIAPILSHVDHKAIYSNTSGGTKCYYCTPVDNTYMDTK